MEREVEVVEGIKVKYQQKTKYGREYIYTTKVEVTFQIPEAFANGRLGRPYFYLKENCLVIGYLASGDPSCTDYAYLQPNAWYTPEEFNRVTTLVKQAKKNLDYRAYLERKMELKNKSKFKLLEIIKGKKIAYYWRGKTDDTGEFSEITILQVSPISPEKSNNKANWVVNWVRIFPGSADIQQETEQFNKYAWPTPVNVLYDYLIRPPQGDSFELVDPTSINIVGYQRETIHARGWHGYETYWMVLKGESPIYGKKVKEYIEKNNIRLKVKSHDYTERFDFSRNRWIDLDKTFSYGVTFLTPLNFISKKDIIRQIQEAETSKKAQGSTTPEDSPAPGSPSL